MNLVLVYFFKTHGVVAKLSVELAITHNDV